MRWTPEVVITLLVRVAGLTLAVVFLQRAISAALHLVLVVVPQLGRFGVSDLITNLVGATWAIGVFVAGVYCFLSGHWLIRRLMAGLTGSDIRCKSCGYDVAGVERGKRCPECGTVRW